jgi:hypothetical protein
VGCPLDLVVVVVQAGDVGIGELCNLARRSTDTAADVEDLHTFLDANLTCQVVFVTGNGLVEGFAVRETAEMEALAPAILVDVGSEVVVAMRAQEKKGQHTVIPISGSRRF